MEITVKNIKVSHAHSEETLCYTATIYVDGKKAFDARNQGCGGCDIYHPVQGYTGPSVAEIDIWLKANKPAEERDGYTLEHDLEIEVGEQIDAHIRQAEIRKTERKLDKMLTTQVAGIKDGGLVTWKAAPTPTNIAHLRKLKPDYEIVNDG